ncbi:phosphotransferase [Demequina activiva]|uniref:Aminoglycoside phosphotransferase n=1 Tax=Demequina activiva TaxID=1582364 RepID=A0A919Q3F9_9MICO|nr:phosphotransferase [Demequina activiva]GIG54186.1 aminoglycoside phosphotransferase [Demequina activiva]
MAHAPEAEISIDAELVRALLADQHPDLAQLRIGARMDGWDNAMFRLGPSLAVRLPRRAVGAEISVTELDWLPRMRRDWTFPAPVPTRIGLPGRGYPWRWSVVPWLQGRPAFEEPLTVAGARDLGAALAQVHRPAPADAPVNPYRSGTLAEVAERCDVRLRTLEETGDLSSPDAELLRRCFQAGADTPEPRRTWAHLDLHGANVLTRDGRLAGIVDWGDAAAADPATDLGQACVLVGSAHSDALLEAYGTAEGTLRVGAGSDGRRRVRARAVAYAVTLATFVEEPYRGAGLRAVAELAEECRSPTG